MKTHLGALICLVFTTAQSFALSGGPPYPGSTNVVGVYAGVIRPKAIPVDSPPGCSANSLGVFSVGVPTSGISTGTFVMFSQGRVFTGTIQGTADPGKATLKAVLSSSVNFPVTFAPTPCPVPTPAPACTPSSFTEEVTATANGSLDTKISTQVSQSNLGVSATRLKGSATIDVSHGQLNPDLSPFVDCEMTLKVSGFKQTDTAPTTSTLGG